MLVVLSPAKKLDLKIDQPQDFSTPMFTEDSEKLIKELRKLKEDDIGKLMGISPQLSALNFERYQKWSINHDIENCKQAIASFSGDAYMGLDAASFTQKEHDFAQEHLRILSGLYGVLKPLDLIHPYRLEMGSKLKVGKKKNLYEFWGYKIVDELNTTLKKLGDNVLINLASNEYFKAINKKKLEATIITPVFKDFKNGQYKSIMHYVKKARGLMTSFIIKNELQNIEDLIAFDVDGYCYNAEASINNELVFLRG